MSLVLPCRALSSGARSTTPIRFVPVLAMHRFVDGDFGSGKTDWYNSTAYLDELMNFLDKHHFSVVPLSSVEAYVISEDPTILPERPLALTIDDGSETILKYFQPRAAAHGFPYAIRSSPAL